MRRKDREMPRAFAQKIVDQCAFATLAMVDVQGDPYCIPVSIVREEDTIYFHCAHEGEKINNMRKSPCVCLSCVGKTHVPEGKFTTEYESAIVFGTAAEVTQRGEKIHALRLLCLRHTPGNMQDFENAIGESLHRTAVWQVAITQMTGKRKQYDQNGKEMKFGRMIEDET